MLGPGFVTGRDFAQKAAAPGHGSQIRLSKPPRVHGLPVIIDQSGFARIGCAHRVRRTRRVDTYQQRWRVWCVTSRRSRDDGVAVVVFERPSTPPAGFAATAVPRDYIKTVFCDVERLLNFLSIGSDGAYYFPVQVLHKLFFMMYREPLEDFRRWYLFLYCRLKLREGSSRLGRAERASARRHRVGDVLHLSKTQ